MSVFECLFTCLVCHHDCFPRMFQCVPTQLRLPPAGMTAPAGNSSGDSERTAAPGGEGEPEELSCPARCSELTFRQNEQRKAGSSSEGTPAFDAVEAPGQRDQSFELSPHRTVLVSATDFFLPCLEAQLRRVELRDWRSLTGLQPDPAESLVQFTYTGEMRVTTANVHHVLELAERLLLVQLKGLCAEFLKKKLGLVNCIMVHSLAHTYNLDELTLRAAEMIRQNFHRLIQGLEFYTLPLHLVRDWLSDSEITVDSEELLFDTVVKWVQRDPQERSVYFEELFQLLRLPQIKPTYLAHVVKKEPLVAKSAVCQQLVCSALETHAVGFENLKPADLDLCGLYMPSSQPRLGQNMDVIMVVGGVSEGGDHLSECVGYVVYEDRWVSLAHIHNLLEGHAVAVTDTHVYVAGSMEAGFGQTVERYDPSLNIWEQVSSLTTHKHSFGLASVRNTLYSFGGHGNSSPSFKDVVKYEPEQDRWHSLESASQILRDVKVVSVEDRFVYVTAQTPVDTDGEDGLKTVITRYDTESHQWEEVDSLPGLDNYCAFQMAVATTKFYHTASCCPKSYNVPDKICQQKISRPVSGDILESLPPEVVGLEGAAVCFLADDVFIIGGWKDGDEVDKQYRKDAYHYSAEKRRWMLLPPMPRPRCRATACHVRIPYRFLRGCQHHPVPQNLPRQQDRMQELHQYTITLRRQPQSQTEC